MKRFFVFLLIFIVIVFLSIAGLTVYVLTNGKNLLLSQIEKGLRVKAQASSVRIVLPGSLIVEDLAIGDRITCQRLTVTPSLLGFLKGQLIFNAIVAQKPVVRVTRNSDDTFDFGMSLSAKKESESLPQGSEAAGSEKEKRSKPVYFYIENIKLIDGRVDFTDEGADMAEPFTGHIVDLQIQIGRVSLLEPTRFHFNAEGRLVVEGENTAARLQSLGWIDPLAKDMDAQLHLTDIDLTAFKPYYVKFMKKDLATGLMMLTASLKSEKNDLTVDGHLELGKVSFKKKDQDQGATQDLSTIAFESVLATDGRVAFDFSIRTKLDRPRLEGLSLKGNFFQNMAGSVLGNSSGQTAPDFKKIGKQFKEFSRQFKQAYKESQGAAS